MELVEGQSLDHSVTPGGPPIPRPIELGIALADALAAAHEKGVVHRDLKPANVMVSKDGRVKVLDFGLAKPAAPDSDLALTTAATVATPLSGEGRWWAREMEVLRSGRADHRARFARTCDSVSVRRGNAHLRIASFLTATRSGVVRRTK